MVLPDEYKAQTYFVIAHPFTIYDTVGFKCVPYVLSLMYVIMKEEAYWGSFHI